MGTFIKKSIFVLSALALTISGLTPASAATVGLQTFSDPYDGDGISDIVEVQVNGFDDEPGKLYVYVTFDEVVSSTDFMDDNWVSIDIDTDGDGEENYWMPSGYDELTSDGQSVTIYNAAFDDTGCAASFFGYPEDEENYVGFQIDATCLALPSNFGVSAYISNKSNDTFDFAPDDGMYQAVNPSQVALLALAKTPVPTITGEGKVGSRLTAKTGAWDTGVTFAYQWLRAGTPISGATTATYLTVSADLGKALSVQVTGSKSGYKSETKTSSGITIALPKFAKSAKPVITGAAKVGSSLGVNTGAWDSGVAFAFQWLRNGAVISGQTGTTYIPTGDDVGKSIAVRIVGTKTGFQTATLESAAVTIKASKLVKTGSARFSGTTKVGKTLTADAGTWDTGVKVTYQWLRNGASISGATKSTYKLTSADNGKNITVAITGTKLGFETVTKVSSGKKITK